MINEYFTPMKRTLILLFSLACVLMSHARVIYLNTGGKSLWNPAESEFFCLSWSDYASKQETPLSKVNELVFKAEINDVHTSIMFVRMPKGAASIAENAILNKTATLPLTSDNDLYTIIGLGEKDGVWSQADEVLKRAVKSNLPLEYNPEKLNPSDAW